ncbi:LmeA family phospholipid-binding protein [Halotia branconii]|uniref:DUF2993 domain-containing protein n=1 Tax=Halotia branconii CENA392 TaxID=1539056 RepID=A0AAJ6NNY4_9CYAN|nr:DUF2993 domain-containing protein [Halotia branconii]WGV24028.1 DUF2993 domain-containing protein [Halotia branconii CENA392]
MPDKQRLEEQLISQEAERRVSDQVDEAEQIDIDVQTDLLQVLRGHSDGVSVAGKGLVLKENIRIQEIKLQTDSISINPLSAIFGQVELNEPVNAIARVVMTQADINCALNSEFARSLSQKFQLDVDGESVSFELQNIQLFLTSDRKIEFQVKVLIKESNNTQSLDVEGIVIPRTNSQPIKIESIKCNPESGLSIELIAAFLQKLKELVKLPYFTWEDIAFSVKQMEIQQENITIILEANVQQLSASKINSLIK